MNCSLGSRFAKIVKRAGLARWPRLFHNLRASRETELAAEFPIHVVTAWLGNTPKIALKHYLMTTDKDFESATQIPTQSVTQNATTHTPATYRNDSQEKKKALGSQGLTRSLSSVCDSVQNTQVAGMGFEPMTSRL